MQFPERHPELALYSRTATVLIILGVTWALIAVLAGTNADSNTEGRPAPWQLAWWESFGWGYGVALIIIGMSVLVVRAIRKRSVLFGDRIRREYK